MTQSEQRNFWDRIQRCDPRILYVLFALLMVTLQFWTVSIPAPVPAAVRALYTRIDDLPPDKIVLIDSSMDAGWIAEAEPVTEAVMRHLFLKKVPFAVCSNTTFSQGQRFGKDIAGRIAAELGKEYGKDYCVWQAVALQGAGGGATIQAMAKDLGRTVVADINGTPLADIPMMKGVTDISGISLIYRVAYDWEYIAWIGFVQAVYGTPYAVGTASISSSSAYPFIDSGQLCGLLPGAAGAAAYERLLKTVGSGTRRAAIQSFASLYVVLAIALGNIAMLAARRQGANSREP